MAFFLTLLYVAIMLLSPGVFGREVVGTNLEVILGGLTILVCLFRILDSGIQTFSETYFTVATIAAVMLSLIATGWLGGAAAAFEDLLPFVVVYAFVVISCTTMARLRILSYLLLAVAAFIVANGVIAAHQNDVASPYLMLEHAGLDPIARIRGLGMLNDPNDLAQFLVMLVPLMFLRWKKGSSVANFFCSILPCAFLVFGVFESRSRGGQLALAVVILFAFKDKLGVVLSGIATAVALAGIIALNVTGGRGFSNDDGDRIGFWSTGLQAIKQHPVFGLGFRNFADVNGGMTAHNSFIVCAAELGMIGYFCWTGLLVASWTDLSAVIEHKARSAKATARQAMRSMAWQRLQEVATAPVATAEVGETRSIALMQTRTRLLPAPAYAENISAPGGSAWASLQSERTTGMQASDESEEDLQHAARMLQVSMVGFLTAGFFLSRAFAAPLFLLLGMCVAVVRLSAFRARIQLRPLFRRTLLFMVLSVAFIYVVVRLRGGR